MTDTTPEESALQRAISATQKATLDPTVVRVSGAGKAYQSVAQSAAIAVQDAADYLRNVGTISATATGVAMAQYVATQGAEGGEALTRAQQLVDAAAESFTKIGNAAASIANSFPSS